MTKKPTSNTSPNTVSSLNFKVSDEFKREFKGYAVSQGISMVDLLKGGFVLSQKNRN